MNDIIVEYIEQRRVVIRVLKRREDQMGDTTRDIVLISDDRKLNEQQLKDACESIRNRS